MGVCVRRIEKVTPVADRGPLARLTQFLEVGLRPNKRIHVII